MSGRMAKAWQRYEREVLPKDASPVQRNETRRAFYAGALVLMGTIMRDLSPEPGMTRGDEKLMDEIFAELDDFMAQQVALADVADTKAASDQGSKGET